MNALILFLIVSCSALEGFEKVIIWGHKIHSSTHSYVHKGFYDAFSHLGYKTYWFDNQDDTTSFDFSSSLFLTEGQVDQKIPIRKDGIYLIHNCSPLPYQNVRSAAFQVYTDDVLERPNAKRVEPFIYFDLQERIVYMPWATHLMPSEIDQMKSALPQLKKEKACYWIGTLGDGYFGNRTELLPFIKACEQNGIRFIAPNPSATGISDSIHQQLIASSYLAPAIVERWQKEKGYIPCRIFKNISYGQMGVTNSLRVYELFEKKIVYNPDTALLFYDAAERMKTASLEEIYQLMDFVKTKHTYLNRVETLLQFLNQLGFLDEE